MVAQQHDPMGPDAQLASNALMSLLREGGQWDDHDDMMVQANAEQSQGASALLASPNRYSSMAGDQTRITPNKGGAFAEVYGQAPDELDSAEPPRAVSLGGGEVRERGVALTTARRLDQSHCSTYTGRYTAADPDQRRSRSARGCWRSFEASLMRCYRFLEVIVYWAREWAQGFVIIAGQSLAHELCIRKSFQIPQAVMRSPHTPPYPFSDSYRHQVAYICIVFFTT